MTAAEELAEGFTYLQDSELEYYNMKYPEGSDGNDTIPYKLENNTRYKNMSLNENPDFYSIPVNTEYSAVSSRASVFFFLPFS